VLRSWRRTSNGIDPLHTCSGSRILYGIFVDQLLDGGAHYYTDEGLCQISWNYRVDDLAALERVFREVQPEHVAIMVDAKLGIPACQYAPLLATVPS
jgi:hypothetical protein